MKPKTIDDYIALQPDTHKEMLEQIREIIRLAAPVAEETISYSIPAFKQNGLLVGFGTHKNGCSFYACSGSLLDEYSKELKEFTRTKSALHLPLNRKLPVALLKKMVKARLKQNKEKVKNKNKV